MIFLVVYCIIFLFVRIKKTLFPSKLNVEKFSNFQPPGSNKHLWPRQLRNARELAEKLPAETEELPALFQNLVPT